jgi:hypothetical protein
MITKKHLLETEFNVGNVISEQKTSKDFSEMISLMIHSQTQVHVFHLQTKTYSEHKALQKYYEGIDGIVDGLVESYQGKYGIIESYKSYDITSYKSTESTIKYLQDLCKKIESLRDCCKDSYIQNQIDAVCELINNTLYKLRFLK